jgi:hypothetical protein
MFLLTKIDAISIEELDLLYVTLLRSAMHGFC